MAAGTLPDFVLAVAYCLAYDRLKRPPDREVLRRLRDGREPQTDEERLLAQMLDAASLALQDPLEDESITVRLQQIQEKASSLGDPRVALIAGGATKIKQYVFESAKLSEIRGASALLDRINLVDMPALFNSLPSDLYDFEEQQRAQDVRRQFENCYGKEPPDCPECVIYANGGEILAFAPASLAQALADEVESLYTSETLIANSVAVWQPFNLVELAGGVQPLRMWHRLEDKKYRQALLRELRLQTDEKLEKELDTKKRFGELAASLALEKFRRREGNPSFDDDGTRVRPPKSTPHRETFAYGRRCRSCERRVASHEYALGDEDPQPVCEPCFQKLHLGWNLKRTWVKIFETFLREQEGRGDAYYTVVRLGTQEDVRQQCLPRKWDNQPLPDRPQDLSEIGQASTTPQGYIGVVYADGNNMGALLEQLRTPAEYRHFADAVYETTQKAVFHALAETLYPEKVNREERKRKAKVKRELWIHPFEILSIGGDDLFLIVPADKALDIGIKIAQQVEDCLRSDPFFQVKDGTGYDAQRIHRCVLNDEDKRQNALPQSKVNLSVGVLLADAHTPIFFLQDLVEQLLKEAKKKAKQLKKNCCYFGGTIDFMVLKSVTMITGKLGQFREEAFHPENNMLEDNVHLLARPYTLLEMRSLLNTVREFKTAGFPRSQLYALRQSLWAGRLPSTLDYLYFTERLDEEHRRKIREVLDSRWYRGEPSPWRRTTSKTWETVLFDLLELYDFVAENE